jgi:hypothetical protein
MGIFVCAVPIYSWVFPLLFVVEMEDVFVFLEALGGGCDGGEVRGPFGVENTTDISGCKADNKRADSGSHSHKDSTCV